MMMMVMMKKEGGEGGGEETRRRRRGEELTLKSNNPNLTGGEKHVPCKSAKMCTLQKKNMYIWHLQFTFIFDIYI